MTDQDLRAMIRESIARHLGRSTGSRPAGSMSFDTPEFPSAAHASHLRLLLRSGDDDGACLIESAVRCSHCGYCQSLGH